MAKQTKKLTAQTTTTTVASGEKLPKVNSSGQVTLIDLANLKAALLAGVNLNAIEDGVFIMFHRKSDDYPLMVKPHKWTSYQNSGEIAEGVVVVEGGRLLVVAPTEADSAGLLWSSAAVSGGAVTTTDRETAYSDFAGRSNTTKILAASTTSAVTNTPTYAAGFCNAYARVNANGKGMTAGRWWLPSEGELFMIYANMQKINYALSLINGAAQLAETWYWSSTENSAANAWSLSLNAGNMYGYAKASDKGRVRPVSAFLR